MLALVLWGIVCEFAIGREGKLKRVWRVGKPKPSIRMREMPGAMMGTKGKGGGLNVKICLPCLGSEVSSAVYCLSLAMRGMARMAGVRWNNQRVSVSRLR